MKLKSYHTATVEAAIRLAHIELGDEAVFLGSRRNDVGSDPEQAYEVTFALMEAEQGTVSGVNEARAAAAAANGVPQRLAPAVPQAATNRAVSPPAESTPAADEGAFLSWKKLLRHVSLRDGKGLKAESQNGSESNRTAPANHLPAAGFAGVNGALRNGSLPHWKDFVPGELRESLNTTPLALDAAARRSLSANGSAKGATSPAPPAAPSQPAPLLSSPPVATPSVPAARRNGSSSASAAPAPSSRPPSGGAADGTARPASRARLMETDEVIETETPASTRNAHTPVPAPAEPQHASIYSLEQLGAELAELRRLFERQQEARPLPPPPSQRLASDARLDEICRGLIENAVEPPLAAEIVAGLRPAAEQGADGKHLAALLAREIRRRLKTDSALGGGNAVSVAAIVGPSGAGKTTAVAKLAFRGLLGRRRVRLLSVDQLRIGAVEPLQAYAELMNAPLEIIDDFERFSRTLGALASSGPGEGELVLIDTPGYGRREWERARRLAAAFSEHGGVDVHLVLDLRTKNDDLRRAIEQYRVFAPTKLLFTRLDETTTFGAMLNETVRTGLPLSFVSVGQRVPEDIVPAGEPELLRLLLKDRSTN